MHLNKREKGLTLTELMIALVVFSLIVPTITALLMNVTRGFSAYEAASQITTLNQKTLSRIYLNLTGSRRIFENSAGDNLFLARISLSDSPARLSGYTLPTIREDGILTPDSTDFIHTNVGNSVFFIKNDATQIFKNIADTGGSTHTVKMDTYRFHYYYLTTDNPKSISDRPSYRLVEYTSVRYADYSQLLAIQLQDATWRSNIVQALKALSPPVDYALDSSATDVTKAFYILNSNGTISSSSEHMIVKYKATVLTQLITGIMGIGYRYGISPNSAGWARAPKVVPRYATGNVNFPSGFEVTVVGQSGGRKVLIREVLVAQIGPKVMGDERLVLCSARDVW